MTSLTAATTITAGEVEIYRGARIRFFSCRDCCLYPQDNNNNNNNNDNTMPTRYLRDTPPPTLPSNIYPGAALIATGLAYQGLHSGSLSRDGAAAAWAVGYAHLANPIKLFGVAMIVFYLVGSRATKVGMSRGAGRKVERRWKTGGWEWHWMLRRRPDQQPYCPFPFPFPLFLPLRFLPLLSLHLPLPRPICHH
jgi:hypothetical protein